MKAIKYCGVKNVKLIDIPKPQITDNQVLVKVKYCGVSGIDVEAYHSEGIFDWEMILGRGVVGEIAEVGKNVPILKQGDRVAVGTPGGCGECYACRTGHPSSCRNAIPSVMGIGPDAQGGFAEYIVSSSPKNELVRIPDSIGFEQAALFEVFGNTFHAVRESKFKIGDDVVVSGCDAVGLSFIYLLRAGGAHTIVALDSDEENRAAALRAGADYAFDETDPDEMEEAFEILRFADGAQVCYSASGAPDSIEACMSLCMAGGQVVVAGHDVHPMDFVAARVVPGQYELKFAFSYTKEELVMVFALMERGILHTEEMTMRSIPIEECVSTLERLGTEKQDARRILIEP